MEKYEERKKKKNRKVTHAHLEGRKTDSPLLLMLFVSKNGGDSG
jgi:hypothetical protein